MRTALSAVYSWISLACSAIRLRKTLCSTSQDTEVAIAAIAARTIIARRIDWTMANWVRMELAVQRHGDEHCFAIVQHVT